MKSRRNKTAKELFILSIALLICISTTAIAYEHGPVAAKKPVSKELWEAEYAFIEALPIEVAVQITDVADQRHLIDRITLDMLGEIPVYNPYACNKTEEVGMAN